MEEAVREENFRTALAAVKRNRGSAGIDRMRADELEGHFELHWPKIRAKLLAGTCTPAPVKRVEIPKPNGGKRRLGIPTVVDRFVEQLLLQAMTPICDPGFSEHSYGFRPGRSAQEAVRAAQGYFREGQTWVVDMDITKFFDHVNHDILMGRIGQTIRDKRVLSLIGKYLRRGAMIEGAVVRSEAGTPQGGPLSPLLANICLDRLDQELERRGHSFCRYADDCSIYVGSEAAAGRVLASIRRWIETQLRLASECVQERDGPGVGTEFLGFRINREGKIEVAPESLKRFKAKVRELWRANQSRTSRELRDRWKRCVQGWWSYFQRAEERREVFRLEGWIRRHIGKCFWLRWHGVAGRLNALRRLGLRGRMLKVAHTSKGAWRIARSTCMHTALNKRTLDRYGFIMPSDLAEQT